MPARRREPGQKQESPQQAAAIAFRGRGRDIQVCLIRRLIFTQWGIPKGLIEPGETPEEAALKEAWEEAGIRGRLIDAALGTYEYEKWGTTLTVMVYLMEVLEEEDTWEESSVRARRWVSLDEAASLLAAHPVRKLLDGARLRLAERMGES